MSRKAWASWLKAQRGAAQVQAASPGAPKLANGRTALRQARKGLADRLREIAATRDQDDSLPALQEFAVTPVPKPRMTRADRWQKRDCVLRYRAYCDTLRLMGAKLPHAYRLQFVLPMPAGWDEATKSEMDGQPHLVRPDTSNLVKAVEDALVPKDERLHRIAASKVWGREGKVRILRDAAPTTEAGPQSRTHSPTAGAPVAGSLPDNFGTRLGGV